jgi:ankyrin repeat protein
MFKFIAALICLSCILSPDVSFAQLSDANRMVYNAILNKDTALLDKAILQGASLSTFSIGDTIHYDPVLMAVIQGDLDILDVLLKNGADLGEGNNVDIFWACRFGNLPVVKYLWDHGVRDTANILDIPDGVCNGLSYSFAPQFLINLNWLSMTTQEKAAANYDTDAVAAFFTGMTTFHPSAEHLETLKYLASLGLNLNQPDANGKTPIMYAYDKGAYALSQFLISQGVLPPPVSVQQQLSSACANGDTASVKALLQNGADPNTADENGNYGLIEAAHGQYYNVVDLLLKSGADINVADGAGLTALMMVCQNGNDTVARELITAGASVMQQDKKGVPVIFYAAQSGNYDLFIDLINKGADATIVASDGNTIYHYIFINGPFSGQAFEPVDYQNAHLKIIAFLLSKKVPFELKDNVGNYPIVYLIKSASTDNAGEIFSLYFAAGLSADQLAQGLQEAIQDYRVGYMEQILPRVNLSGITPSPLYTAIIRGNEAAVKDLIKDSIDVNAVMWDRSMLLLAFEMAKEDICRMLIKAGADINYVSPGGLKVLDYAPGYPDIFLPVILRSQLLNINNHQAITDFNRTDITLFNNNNQIRPSDVTFTVTGFEDANAVTEVDNFTNTITRMLGALFLYGSNVTTGTNPLLCSFNANQHNFIYTKPVTWEMSASCTVGACAFNAANNATCYPKVVIKNTGRDGPVIARQNGMDYPLNSNDMVALNRSVGPITVLMDKFRKTDMAMAWSLAYNMGPEIMNLPDFTPANRIKVYSGLYFLNNQLANSNNGIDAAVYQTAIHITSEYAVANRYELVIKALLNPLITRINSLPAAVTSLRKFFILHEQVDLSLKVQLMSEIDGLIAATTDPAQLAGLKQIRATLDKANDNSTLADGYAKLFYSDFFNRLKGDISQMQLYLLELAQYVDESSIPAESGIDLMAGNLKNNILPDDIIIKATDVAGKGKTLLSLITDQK